MQPSSKIGDAALREAFHTFQWVRITRLIIRSRRRRETVSNPNFIQVPSFALSLPPSGPKLTQTSTYRFIEEEPDSRPTSCSLSAVEHMQLELIKRDAPANGGLLFKDENESASNISAGFNADADDSVAAKYGTGITGESGRENNTHHEPCTSLSARGGGEDSGGGISNR
jgi:hypothetical protein